jgi:hypothetical protein
MLWRLGFLGTVKYICVAGLHLLDGEDMLCEGKEKAPTKLLV